MEGTPSHSSETQSVNKTQKQRIRLKYIIFFKSSWALVPPYSSEKQFVNEISISQLMLLSTAMKQNFMLCFGQNQNQRDFYFAYFGTGHVIVSKPS